MTSHHREDRSRGALAGLALGAALGTPMRGLSRALIAELYGQPLPGFEEPSHTHDQAAGGMLAGAISSRSFGEAMAVADHLIAHAGEVSLDSLAPHLSQSPGAVAGRSIGNSAAVRCIPAAIAMPSGDLEALVAVVAELSEPTHGSQVAIAAAAAVAAATSTAIDTGNLDAAIAAAVKAARIAPQYGQYVSAPNLAQRLDWALACVDPNEIETSIQLICDLVGTARTAQESIPAAFAVLATLGPLTDPWLAARWAACLGGASAVIAGIVGAISGACQGVAAINPDALAALEAANPDLELARRSEALDKLRG